MKLCSAFSKIIFSFLLAPAAFAHLHCQEGWPDPTCSFLLPPCALLKVSCAVTSTYSSLSAVGTSGGVIAGMPAQGTTLATFDSQFPVVLLWAFNNNPYIDQQMTNLDNGWIARLSHMYYIDTQGNISPLLIAAAQHLSASNLLRFAAAFGTASVNAAVTSYAPASVSTAYFAQSPLTMIQQSQSHYNSLGLTGFTPPGAKATYVPQPLINMALNDIFLEFYAAGVGTTMSEAAIMMAV